MDIYREQNKWSRAIDSLNESKEYFDVDIVGSPLTVDGLKGYFYIDKDGWDRTSQMFRDMKNLRINDNDPWIDDINDALEKYGLELDNSKNHKIVDLDGGEMILNLRKII